MVSALSPLEQGCPVEFCWTGSMALIPLGSGRFADDPDTRRGVNAMRHQNSVFHGVLKHLPWGEFDRLVAAHGADSRVRRLTTKDRDCGKTRGMKRPMRCVSRQDNC